MENVIRHGIIKKGGSGTVTISTKETPEVLLIEVADNGSGIPQEKLTRIFEVETGESDYGISTFG